MALPLLLALAASPAGAREFDGHDAGGPGWDRRGGSAAWGGPLGWLRHSRDSFQRMMRQLANRSAELRRPKRAEPDWPPMPPEREERRRTTEPGRDRTGPRVREWQQSWSSSCRRAGMPVEGAGWYVVAPGDTLWRIARAHYGNGRAWRRILHANWDAVSDPNLIYACQRLFIPRWHTDRPPCDEPSTAPPRPACLPPRPDRAAPGGCSRCGAGAHAGAWGWR